MGEEKASFIFVRHPVKTGVCHANQSCLSSPMTERMRLIEGAANPIFCCWKNVIYLSEES